MDRRINNEMEREQLKGSQIIKKISIANKMRELKKLFEQKIKKIRSKSSILVFKNCIFSQIIKILHIPK